MKHTWMMLLPLLSVACLTNPEGDPTATTEEALSPVAVKAMKVKRTKSTPVKVKPIKPGGPLSCATVLCASGYECVENKKGPTCEPTITCANVLCPEGHECVESPQGPECIPSLSCANVLCAAGHECVEDCDGDPACVPTVCEGFAGLACPDGFACELAGKNPDEGGTCTADCETCGECTSNQDCGKNQVCTTSFGDCLASCSCPMCSVCAGECVDATAKD